MSYQCGKCYKQVEGANHICYNADPRCAVGPTFEGVSCRMVELDKLARMERVLEAARAWRAAWAKSKAAAYMETIEELCAAIDALDARRERYYEDDNGCICDRQQRERVIATLHASDALGPIIVAALNAQERKP